MIFEHFRLQDPDRRLPDEHTTNVFLNGRSWARAGVNGLFALITGGMGKLFIGSAGVLTGGGATLKNSLMLNALRIQTDALIMGENYTAEALLDQILVETMAMIPGMLVGAGSPLQGVILDFLFSFLGSTINQELTPEQRSKKYEYDRQAAVLKNPELEDVLPKTIEEFDKIADKAVAQAIENVLATAAR